MTYKFASKIPGDGCGQRTNKVRQADNEPDLQALTSGKRMALQPKAAPVSASLHLWNTGNRGMPSVSGHETLSQAVSQKEAVPQQLITSDKTQPPAEYKEVASMSATPGMCHSE